MKPTLLNREFRKIPVEDIVPNPNQPRRIFDEDAISELSRSISRYGVITPLTVRKTAKDLYELVAGERRLRASKLAGLKTVPCYIISVDSRESSMMAIVENLQRRDLDFFEEALSIRCLMEKYGLTQAQTAERIGKTQSAVANKLRLLKLSPETVKTVRQNGLSERHARALLRLSEEDQEKAAAYISENKLTVEKTEIYIEELLQTKTHCVEKAEDLPKNVEKTPNNTEKASKRGKKRQASKVLVKDIRIFLNTVKRAAETMRLSGFTVKIEESPFPTGTELRVKVER